jgi:hypothetical protein
MEETICTKKEGRKVNQRLESIKKINGVGIEMALYSDLSKMPMHTSLIRLIRPCSYRG